MKPQSRREANRWNWIDAKPRVVRRAVHRAQRTYDRRTIEAEAHEALEQRWQGRYWCITEGNELAENVCMRFVGTPVARAEFDPPKHEIDPATFQPYEEQPEDVNEEYEWEKYL